MLKSGWRCAVVSLVSFSLLLGGCGGEVSVTEAVEDPSTYASEAALDINSEYYYLEDLDTGSVLLDEGSTQRMFPASLTKMMTAIVAFENIPDPENVTIEITRTTLAGLIEASANRAGYWYGDTPTALDLIYGVLLPSGADCCRALALYDSEDENCLDIDDEYMLGDGLLVAPVLDMGEKRDVYLPAGSWKELFTGKILEGGRWLRDYVCPMEIIPVFVCAGTESKTLKKVIEAIRPMLDELMKK